MGTITNIKINVNKIHFIMLIIITCSFVFKILKNIFYLKKNNISYHEFNQLQCKYKSAFLAITVKSSME